MRKLEELRVVKVPVSIDSGAAVTQFKIEFEHPPSNESRYRVARAINYVG